MKVCNSILSCLFDLKCTEEVYRGKSVPKQKSTLHRDTVSYIICSETQCSSKDLFEGKGLVNIKKKNNNKKPNTLVSNVQRSNSQHTVKLWKKPSHQHHIINKNRQVTLSPKQSRNRWRNMRQECLRPGMVGGQRKKIKMGTAMRKVRTNPGPQTLETGQQSGSFA